LLGGIELAINSIATRPTSFATLACESDHEVEVETRNVCTAAFTCVSIPAFPGSRLVDRATAKHQRRQRLDELDSA
jgi:hypothetical protein